MTTPTTFPSGYSFVGLAKEAVQGTAVAPTDTLMINAPAQSKDNLTKLEDVGLRQSLTDVYGLVPGPLSSETSFAGDVRVDTIVHLLQNIMGDRTSTGAATPYVHAISLYNTTPAQPPSYTVTDFSGVTASVGARAYPGCMFSELTFTIEPDKLFDFSAKAVGWGSAASAAAPSPSVSSLTPQAGWNFAVGIGGPASGGTLVKNVTTMTVTLTREVKVYPAVGAQQPYIVRAGKFGMAGQFSLIAADEAALTSYLNNNTLQMQLILNAGASNIFQIDMTKVAYKAAALNRGDTVVMYDVDFTAIGNTTDVGTSGGFSPGKITVTNSVAGTEY